MTKGEKIRGVWWSPPKRCGHYAGEDGYCGVHRPAERTDAILPEMRRDACCRACGGWRVPPPVSASD